MGRAAGEGRGFSTHQGTEAERMNQGRDSQKGEPHFAALPSPQSTLGMGGDTATLVGVSWHHPARKQIVPHPARLGWHCLYTLALAVLSPKDLIQKLEPFLRARRSGGNLINSGLTQHSSCFLDYLGHWRSPSQDCFHPSSPRPRPPHTSQGQGLAGASRNAEEGWDQARGGILPR